MNMLADMTARIRNYPLFEGETVMESYQWFISEGEAPKDAWRLAQRLHRSVERNQAEMVAFSKEYGHLLPDLDALPAY